MTQQQLNHEVNMQQRLADTLYVRILASELLMRRNHDNAFAFPNQTCGVTVTLRRTRPCPGRKASSQCTFQLAWPPLLVLVHTLGPWS